jgi:small subunit ribosomal protein S2
MAIVTMRQMLDSGVHFGHQTRRWNPKMKRFILTERNGIYIIDLAQTVSHTDTAFNFVKNTVTKGGSILFIGTKKQAQEAVAEQATRVNMPYVNQRWLGGMLTNFETVSKRLARLKELEEMNLDDASASSFTKKELLMMRRERDKLARTLGGIRNMTRRPAAVWIVDTKKEHLAVDEARKLGLPIVAILDTNADPDEVDYAIPGNDDAIRSVALLTRVIADAVAEGLMARHAKAAEQDAGEQPEPMAEWETELLAAADVGAPAVPAVDSPDPTPAPAAALEAAGAPEPAPEAAADANTAAVAAKLDTTDAEELGAVDAADPATSFAAESPAEAAAAQMAAAGGVRGVEVTAKAAETPLTDTVASATAPAPAAAQATPATEFEVPPADVARPDLETAKGPGPAALAKPPEPAAPAKEPEPVAAEEPAEPPKAPEPTEPPTEPPNAPESANPAKPKTPDDAGKPAETDDPANSAPAES